MPSNNEILEDMAGLEDSHKTNNQLLQEILDNGGGGGGGAVSSVNGQTGAVVLDAADVGAAPATYDAVVPATHATLEEAVTDGKTNIFLSAGVHEVAADLTVSQQVIITGVQGQSIISLTNYALLFSEKTTLRDLAFLVDNGYLRFNGNNALVENNIFIKNEGGTGSLFRLNAESSLITNNLFMKNSEARVPCVEIWKASNTFQNNIMQLRDMGNTIYTAALSLTSNPYTTRIVGNRFTTNGSDPWSNDSVVIGMTHADGQIDGNYFENLLSSGFGILCDDYDEVIVNNRSVNMATFFKATNGSAQYRRTYNISGNLIAQGTLDMSGCHDATVTNNYISHSTPMSWTGVEAIIFTGNQVRNCGLTLDATSTKNILTNNTIFNSTGSFPNTITDNGTDNVLTPNIDGRTV